MTISKALLDELLSGVEKPEDFFGDKGLMKELKVRLMERMLGAELTAHLGYEPNGEPVSQQANRRNGAARKVLKGNDGAVPIDIPRDRDGSFEPELIRKGQTRIDGIDDKIIGLYAAGLSTRDIRGHLEEVYGLKVSADLISRVTDAVLEEVSDWQNRALEPVYPIVKIRRHYTVDETIVMALPAWAAFGKLSKSKVQPLLKKLTKLGALKLVQKGKVGSKAGIASKYKRLL